MKLEKSQKKRRKRNGKRAFKAFIHKVRWWDEITKFGLDISYIYKKANLKSVTYKNKQTIQQITLPKLPRWKDVTRIQSVAYFSKFLAGRQHFSNVIAFTLDLSYTLHDRYKRLKLAEIRNALSKKIHNNLRHHFTSDTLLTFIIEGKNKRINVHGFVDGNNISELKTIMKQSACSFRGEYTQASYRNMLQFSDIDKSYGWFCYMNKGGHSENGLYISHGLLEKIRSAYLELYDEYQKIMKEIQAEGVKIRYTEDTEQNNVFNTHPPA